MFLRGPRSGTKDYRWFPSIVHARSVPRLGLRSLGDHSPPYASTLLMIRESSSSSKRWQNRQGRDKFATNAKVQGLKSRAAFKLLEVHHELVLRAHRKRRANYVDQINEKYRIFRSGQTVVDLVSPFLISTILNIYADVLSQGYAPGSWSQVHLPTCSHYSKENR